MAGGRLSREIGGAPLWLLLASAVLVVGFVVAILGFRATPDRYVPATTDIPLPGGTTSAPATPVALFIGDSYSAGAGAATPDARWTTLAARELGWLEVNAALGGTGYVATSDEAGCGLPYCAAYPEVLAQVSVQTPDIVVISGGRNDSGDLAVFRTGVETTLSRARSRWPHAEVVVTNPLGDDDPLPAALSAKIPVVHELADEQGAEFLDIGQPLGGHTELVAGDGVHPNDGGHQAIADAFVAAWRSAHPS